MTAKVTAAILLTLLSACAPISKTQPTGSVGFTGISGDRPVIYPADITIWKAY